MLIRYPFVPITIAFAAGLAVTSAAPVPLAAALVLWPLAAGGALALGRLERIGALRAAAAAMLLAFFLAGASWRTLSTRPAPDDLSRLAAERPVPMRLRARVREVPLPPHPDDPDPRPGSVVVDITAVGSGRARRTASGRALLSSREPLGDIWPLDEIEVLASVRLPQGARAPGAFDRRAALAREGIRLEVTASPSQVKLVARGPALSPRRACARLRAHLAGVLRRTLPARESELLCALLLGYRPGIDPEVRARFAESGLGHLLAVSGLHLAILAGLLGGLLRLAGVRRRPAAVVLAVFAVFYAMLAGARPPVVRAATMVVTYLAATILGRDRDLPNTVAFAAFALLLWRPGWLLDAGFQLSFAAVGFLAFLYPILADAWAAFCGRPEEFMEPLPENRFERAVRRARQALFISAAAWLGVQPLLLHYLGFVNPWAVLSNVVVLPLAAVALAGGVGLLAAGAILPPLGAVFAYPARLGLGILLAAVEVFAFLPGSAAYLPSPGRAWLLAYYGLALALFLRAPSVVRAFRDPPAGGERLSASAPARPRPRSLALAAAAVFALVAVSAAAAALMRGGAPPSPSVTVFHLGKSRAALVRTARGADILVNAGSFGTGTALTRRLRELGVRRLACLVVMRDDERHAGGLARVLENMPVACLALPREGASGRGGPPSELVRRATRLARDEGAALFWPAPPDELAAVGDEVIRWPRLGGDLARQSAAAVEVIAGGGLEVLFFEPGRGRARGGGAALERASGGPGARVLVFLPPGRPGASPRLTAERAARDASAVTRLSRPRAVLVPLSSSEAVFPGPAAALRGLRSAAAALVRTDLEGTARAYPEGTRLVVERWHEDEWRRVFSR